MSTDAATESRPVPGNVAAQPEAVAATKTILEAAGSAASPSANGKIYADWDELVAKNKRWMDYPLIFRQPDGAEKTRYIRLEAISTPEYDALLDEHKPNSKQRDQGEVFNRDTFMPALIAACAVKPKLTIEQLSQLREAKTWSPGEFGGIFMACQRICNATADVSFTATG